MQVLPETDTPLAQRSTAGEEVLAEKRTDAILKGAYYIYVYGTGATAAPSVYATHRRIQPDRLGMCQG